MTDWILTNLKSWTPATGKISPVPSVRTADKILNLIPLNNYVMAAFFVWASGEKEEKFRILREISCP
jgi:hypothetical protein